MISVSIVEDHNEFRQVLAGFIGSQPDFRLTGVYSNADAAMEGLLADQPQIAIIDIQMPGITGIELIKKIRSSVPSTQFLICTSHFDNDSIFQALKAGASGYILKDSDSATIRNAVIELFNGGAPMSPYIARKVISHIRNIDDASDGHGLTMREKEVLQLLAKGLLYKEIADTLSISVITVKNHLKNIYAKLHVQNKIEALNKYKAL
ncbi:MAG: response regulator transcription factor [Bacteroidetes bacterium]|nr:response regulator transcription factor [Bacteroidota bacterium]